MKINDKGIWENPTAEGHAHDDGLANALVEFFKKEEDPKANLKIMDIGCGDGFYSRKLYDNYFLVKAFDGNPNTPALTRGLGEVQDFTMPLDLGARDWVLCLEVGEHIPHRYENTFIENLDRHNKKGIVLSWAVRGQKGDGHVNCLNNNEVIPMIERLGYELDAKASMKLRESCSLYPKDGYWFRDTLMVFRRI